MKKPILILSIVAIAVAAVALLLGIAFLTVFWEPVCMLYVSAPEDVIAAGPIIPNGSIVYMVACLVIAVAACIFTKTSKTIVFEIIAIAFLSIIIPVLVWRLSMAQTVEIGQTMGAVKLTALSVANNISSFATKLMAVSEALCLVVCGMSISEKIITKKIASKANQPIE